MAAMQKSLLSVDAWGIADNDISPHFILSLDGQPIGEVTVTNAERQTYSFEIEADPSRSHSIRIHYDNDAGSAERTLFVDSISVNGRVLLSDGAGVVYDRGALDGRSVIAGRSELTTNGALEFEVPASYLAPPAGPVDPVAGLWVWSTREVLSDGVEFARLLEACRETGINKLYLYMHASDYDTFANDVRHFNAELSKIGIEVWALDGDRQYFSDLKGPANLYAGVEQLIAFNAASTPDQRFVGFQSDIEPQDNQVTGASLHFYNGLASSDLSPAQAAQREALMVEWIEMHAELSRTLHGAGLKLGAAMPSWLDNYYGEPITAHYEGKDAQVIEHMMPLLDEYHVMSYNTDVYNNARRVLGELQHAETLSPEDRPLIFAGVETNKTLGADVSYGDHPDKSDTDAITRDMQLIAEQLDGYAAFAGVDIHDWIGLSVIDAQSEAPRWLDERSESPGEADAVVSSSSHVLGEAAKNLILLGTDDLNGTGNGLANCITGNAGDNRLYGNGGGDALDGAAGADILYGGHGNDTLDGGAGDDGLYGGTGDDVLRGAMGRDVINGSSGNDRLDGGDGNDCLNGESGNDRLDGSAGDDLMSGGTGDDVYLVDSAGDLIVEAPESGKDQVETKVSYALGSGVSVEVLRTAEPAATASINLTGNQFANRLEGNRGANILDGATGKDTMIGGAGDDTYFVDHAGDVVTEIAGGGFDRVLARVDYKLTDGSEVELLATADDRGMAPLRLTGNRAANTILGNEGDNVLDGGTGSDVLVGKGGNDIYYVNEAGDRIVEGAGAGYDTVLAKSSFSLTAGAEVEKLAAANPSSTTSVTLVGNEFANTLVGNRGDNVLNGGAGTDVLIGAQGRDTFRFDSPLGPSNVDHIEDFRALDDAIQLDRDVFTSFSRTGKISSSAFHIGDEAVTLDHRILYDQRTGTLIHDSDGSGAAAGIVFATLEPDLPLTYNDFFVY